MSQFFKINQSLRVSLSFWRRTLTDMLFIPIFLQQDMVSPSKKYLLDDQAQGASEVILLYIDNSPLHLLHHFPLHENLYT